MFKRLINHVKRWNKWQKHCGNGWLHKISVLFGGYSPTFMFVFTDEEEDEIEQAFMRGMRGNDD